MIGSCPFCDLVQSASPDVRVVGLAAAFRDKYPVSEGHTLVVPLRHEADFTKLTGDEQAAIWALARSEIERLKESLHPDGFNVGVNIGSAGGQTVAHAHLHLIPRNLGDVPEPRGGVRWVVPDRAAYW